LQPLVDSAWFQRLKLRYETPLSNFAFEFTVRRYNLVIAEAVSVSATKVGRCRLTPVNVRVERRPVSAETKI
jgi:hypothetical protein